MALVATVVLVDSGTAQMVRPDSADRNGTLTWRSIGPSTYGGRVEDIAVPIFTKESGIAPGAVMYVAAATGGVFKTTDAGEHWFPLFDREPSAAVHTIAIHPKNPELVWVGTGDPSARYPVVPGTGVYKSIDGGAHWTHVGLDSAVVVSRLALDPTDPNVAYAAVTGTFARPGGMRGVYKTTDGGAHWARVLAGANDWTGAVDLSIDPSNPEVVYAALQQRGHSPELNIDYGPGTGLYKTTDGGKTWSRLAEGLPTGSLERIAVAVSPVKPSTVYAALIAPDAKNFFGFAGATLYRSDDAGGHWQRGATGAPGPWPLRVVPDPVDPTRVFVMGGEVNVFTGSGERDSVTEIDGDARTTDGAPGDTHAIWVDPEHPQHWVVGDDWGVGMTYDGGSLWTRVPTLPIGQFRYIDADRRSPFYWVHGVSQDHSGAAGPSRTRNGRGIAYTDWIQTRTPEGSALAVDPADSATLYSWGESIFSPSRSNIVTREAHSSVLDPRQLQEPTHASSELPLVISPHDHRIVYAGMTRLYRSTDRGDRWTAISPELVRPQRDSLTLMGLSDVHERTALDYDVLSTIAESPLQPGLLYVGTRDGLLHVSRDGGRHWRTVDQFPGVNQGMMLTRVVPSRYAPGTVYLTINAADAGDFAPHVLKSSDFGAHWTALSTAGLPPMAAAWVIREHFRTRGLLFLGADVGVFFSTDDGEHWRSLRLNMPAVRVRDLVLQPQANDLIAGTWGRSIWILDDITPLERLAVAEARPVPTLFPARDATLPLPRLGGDLLGQPVAAPNPDPALFSYYVPARYAHDSISLRIRDAAGALVDSIIDLPHGAGLHRAGWNMHLGSDRIYPPPFQLLPGHYRVSLVVGSYATETHWTVRSDPLTPVSRARRDSIVALRRQAVTLKRRLARTVNEAQRLHDEVDSTAARLERDGRQPALMAEARRLHVALGRVLALNASPAAADAADPHEGGATTRLGAAISIVYSFVGEAVTAPPNVAVQAAMTAAEKQLGSIERSLAALRDVQVPAFRRAVGAAGVSPSGQ